MILLYLCLSVLTLVACMCVIYPLWRTTLPQQQYAEQELNKAWYHKRFQELQLALEANSISQEDYQNSQTQLQRDFLAFSQKQTILKNHTHRILAVILILILIFIAGMMYDRLGSSKALQQVLAIKAQEQRTAEEIKALGGQAAIVEQLKQHLQEHPNEAQGWFLLGRLYFSQNKYHEAFLVFEKAAKLAPNRVDIMTALAESCFLSSDAQDQKQAMPYLNKALQLDPQNPAVLNLWALHEYRVGHYVKAVELWQNLLRETPENTDTAKALQAAIAQALAKIPSQELKQKETAVSIPVAVSLTAVMKNKTDPNDTVFVYAKALNGPPMPLAIARFQVKDLPLQVSLDDSMGMLPNLHMQDFSRVVVVARISKTGSAMAQPGDITVMSQAIATKKGAVPLVGLVFG